MQNLRKILSHEARAMLRIFCWEVANGEEGAKGDGGRGSLEMCDEQNFIFETQMTKRMAMEKP